LSADYELLTPEGAGPARPAGEGAKPEPASADAVMWRAQPVAQPKPSAAQGAGKEAPERLPEPELLNPGRPSAAAPVAAPSAWPPLPVSRSGPSSRRAPGKDAKNQLPPPQPLNQARPNTSPEDAVAEAAACGLANAMPLSLPVALRLAQTTNLDIAQAREVVNGAQAVYTRTQVAILPNFNIGSTYIGHEGMIQNTAGPVIKVNRDSLFVGGGPSLNFALADVYFFRLAAQQALQATQAGYQRVTNDTLLAVADAYFAVMRARRRLARVEETLDFLVSTRPARSRADSRGLLPVLLDFYRTGGAEALLSEVERARVEVFRRVEERAAAVQEYRFASAELSRLLRLDPEIPLWPVEDFRYPIPIPGEGWAHQPLDELARVALNNRPELAENRALVEAALERVRGAKWRPWLPNLILNYNWGDFGGGPDTNPPVRNAAGALVTQAGMGPSGRILHMNTRDDFDVTLVWRFTNMGLGNLADVRFAEADYRRQDFRRLQVQDIVVTQVVQAVVLVNGWRDRMNISMRSLFDDRGRANGPVFQSMRLNFERVRNVPGTRVLEVLDSIRSLNDLLEAYGQDMTDYERSEFRLLIALGLPPDSYFDPHAMPFPPAAGPTAGKPDQPQPQKQLPPPAPK
jgi:outer membrane protein TolC